MYTMQFKNVIQSIESHIRKTGNGYDNSLHNKWFSFSLYLAHTHTQLIHYANAELSTRHLCFRSLLVTEFEGTNTKTIFFY